MWLLCLYTTTTITRELHSEMWWSVKESVWSWFLLLSTSASSSISQFVFGCFIHLSNRADIYPFIHSFSVWRWHIPSDHSKHVAQYLLRFTNWTGGVRPGDWRTLSQLPRYPDKTPAINIGLQISEIYLFAFLFDNKLKFHYQSLTGSFISRAIHSFPLN